MSQDRTGLSDPVTDVCDLGVPEQVAGGLVEVLGVDAAQRIAADPWLVMEGDGVVPGQADRFANRRLGSVDRDDPRRAVALCRWVLGRVGRSGATLVSREVMLAALAGLELGATALAAAVERGAVRENDGWFARSEVAEAEADLAGHVQRLTGSGRDALRVLVGPAGPWRDDAVAALGAAQRVERAERLDTLAAAALLASVPDDGRLVLAGDPLARHSTPGQVLADLVDSGQVPVSRVEADDSTALGRLATALRQGRLEPPDPQDHSLVVVPVDSVELARRRVVQLVSESIPGRLGVPAEDVVVVTLRDSGALGARTLLAHLQEAGAATRVMRLDALVERADPPCPAVVLVLAAEASGSLDLAGVVSVVGASSAHLSVVSEVGDTLVHAVARARPGVRTGVAGLLAGLASQRG